MKTRYEVKIIQDGIPFYDSEEGVDEICFEKKLITTIGVFNSLHYAQIMKKALEEEIAESNDYIYSRYAAQVDIYEVRTVEEVLNL